MNSYFHKILEDREEERLDKFLRRKYPNVRLSVLQKFIRLGKVYVDEKKVKNGATRLKKGQSVLVNITDSPREVEKKYSVRNKRNVHVPVSLDLNVIYEDDYMLAINKDVGIPVQPGRNTSNISVYNALLNLKGEFYLVHRLDKYTSGVLIVSKNYEFTKKMAALFKNHSLNKRYITLVHGLITEKTNIEEPLDGKHAFSVINPIDFFKDFTLLKVEIQTGRKHQIRRHLAIQGTPVVGDDVYGARKKNAEFRRRFDLKGYFLHCEEISFFHPTLKRKISITAPLSNKRKEIIEKLKRY